MKNMKTVAMSLVFLGTFVACYANEESPILPADFPEEGISKVSFRDVVEAIKELPTWIKSKISSFRDTNNISTRNNIASPANVSNAASSANVSNISERDGIFSYYSREIFDANSTAGHIAAQEAKMQADGTLQALKDSMVDSSREKVDAALLNAWCKDNPVQFSTADKVVGVSLFVGVLAIVYVYNNYMYTPQEAEEVQDLA